MVETTKVAKKPVITKSQIATILFAVLLMTIIAHYDDFLPYRWQTFRARDGSFSVEFPGKPVASESPVQLAAGGTAVADVITAQPRKDAVYTCAYFVDPRLASSSAEDALSSAREGSVSRVQGTVVNERNIEVDGYPAQDVAVRARGNSLMDMRLIAVGRRMFALMVIDTDRQQPDSKDIQKFFDSLKLSK